MTKNRARLVVSVFAVMTTVLSARSAHAGTPCFGNINNTGTSANRVDVDDLLAVISQWGPCPAPPAICPANVVNTGTSANKVDIDDLLLIVSAWGPCP